MALFKDRTEAGEALARKMPHFKDAQPLVLALPRGGVPVAFPIARALFAPLDVIVTRPLRAPGRPELDLGAIAEGGASCIDLRLLVEAGVSSRWVEDVMEIERHDLVREVRAYREGRPFPDVHGRPVVLVDDGLSSVVTIRAAARALRLHGPHTLVLAVPVWSPKVHSAILSDVDDVVCAAPPEELAGFGMYEDYFAEATVSGVHDLLARAREQIVSEGSGVDHETTLRWRRERQT